MAQVRSPLKSGNSIATYTASAPTLINLSVASANIGPLKKLTGYRLWASVDAFFMLGGDGTVAATTSSHPIKAGLDTLHLTDELNLYLAGIVASGTGVLYISEIGVGPLDWGGSF